MIKSGPLLPHERNADHTLDDQALQRCVSPMTLLPVVQSRRPGGECTRI